MARRRRTSASAHGALLAVALAAATLIAAAPGRTGPVVDRAEAAVPTARFALDGPRGIVVRRTRVPGALGPRVEVYRRAGDRPPRAAVLLVHGGGWSGGGLGRMAPVALAVARAGMVAVNVGYTVAAPLAAGHPRQLEELRATVRWLRRHARRLGIDRRAIGAMGSSAGGHLASLLATRATGRLDRGARIAAAVAWSPPVDLPALAGHRTLGPAATLLVGCPADACADSWADASPLTHVTPDDPPLLLVNSREEMVPASQAVAMAERLAAAAVPHTLWLLDGNAHGREFAGRALARSIAFLKRWLRP